MPRKEPPNFIVVHDKGQIRKLSAQETPRERMIRVVLAVQKKQKQKR